jgi:hypothetical protein
MQASGDARVAIGLSQQSDVFGDQLSIKPSLGRSGQQTGMFLRYELEVLSVAPRKAFRVASER